MTDRDEGRDAELDQVRRAANELIPQLTERLARQGLGELEVRVGELRVRVVATRQPAGGGPGPAIVATRPASGDHAHAGHPPHATTSASTTHGVTSPAIGFFAYADGLGPGLAVEKGDALGHVDMLGVRHEVRAPRSGTVRHLVTEAGDPVEYGQVLIELEPVE